MTAESNYMIKDTGIFVNPLFVFISPDRVLLDHPVCHICQTDGEITVSDVRGRKFKVASLTRIQHTLSKINPSFKFSVDLDNREYLMRRAMRVLAPFVAIKSKI